MRMLHIMLLNIYISLILMVIFCRTKTSDRSVAMGSDYDLPAIFWEDFILDIRQYSCNQVNCIYTQEETSDAAG